MLKKVNEALPMEKLSKVVYQTPAAVAIATSVRPGECWTLVWWTVD